MDGQSKPSIVINSDGKVGMGVDTPLATLHVAGDVRATGKFLAEDGTVSNPGIAFSSDATTGIHTQDSTTGRTVALITGGLKAIEVSRSDYMVTLSLGRLFAFHNRIDHDHDDGEWFMHCYNAYPNIGPHEPELCIDPTFAMSRFHQVGSTFIWQVAQPNTDPNDYFIHWDGRMEFTHYGLRIGGRLAVNGSGQALYA